MHKPPIYQFSLARDQTKDNRIKSLRQAYELHHGKLKNRRVFLHHRAKNGKNGDSHTDYLDVQGCVHNF